MKILTEMEEILQLDSDTLHKCRYILEKFEPRELEEIFDGTDNIAKYYKRVMNAEERLRKKNMEQEKRLKALIENKASDIPLVFRGKKWKERNKNNTRRIRTMDNLVLKTFPKLYKRTADMYEVRKAMEYYKAEGAQVFEAASSRPAIQRFLGSLFVNDFIALLECLDYKVEKPAIWKLSKRYGKKHHLGKGQCLAGILVRSTKLDLSARQKGELSKKPWIEALKNIHQKTRSRQNHSSDH